MDLQFGHRHPVVVGTPSVSRLRMSPGVSESRPRRTLARPWTRGHPRHPESDGPPTTVKCLSGVRASPVPTVLRVTHLTLVSLLFQVRLCGPSWDPCDSDAPMSETEDVVVLE